MGENPRSGSGLHSILTSSQSHRWARTFVLIHDIHGVFKRPQLSAFEMTREVIARAPPPAFLFPYQQCQRPKPPQRPHPFNARCRRRRLSIQPRIPCQIVFCKTIQPNPPEPTKANPSRSWRPSSEERQSSQERIPKNSANDLRRPRSNSHEFFPNPQQQHPIPEIPPLDNFDFH